MIMKIVFIRDVCACVRRSSTCALHIKSDKPTLADGRWRVSGIRCAGGRDLYMGHIIN